MLHPFRYLAPRSAQELAAMLADHASDGKILAGGTDLIPNIRNGVFKPAVVIDVKKLPDASSLRLGSDGLSLGPAVTVNDILRSKDARERYPVLCACAHELASHQVRNRATVAGNVVNASPCSDMAPALLCLDAVAVIGSGTGQRELPFREFFTGVKKTALKPGEWLDRIVVPASSAGARGSYLKLKRIAGHDLGIVGVLFVRLGGSLRFGVSSAAPTPVLVDTVTAKDGPDQAAATVLGSVSPISDVRGTKEYRQHMIGVFVRRLIAEVK
ncbi:MAG: FAD binding domain-containing protein [Spirochaetia bacterium]|nr:FAD binding domain-containing protein [Spirochaetia bacterium]